MADAEEKAKKEAELDRKIAEIRKRDAERKKRYEVVEADKNMAELTAKVPSLTLCDSPGGEKKLSQSDNMKLPSSRISLRDMKAQSSKDKNAQVPTPDIPKDREHIDHDRLERNRVEEGWVREWDHHKPKDHEKLLEALDTEYNKAGGRGRGRGGSRGGRGRGGRGGGGSGRTPTDDVMMHDYRKSDRELQQQEDGNAGEQAKGAETSKSKDAKLKSPEKSSPSAKKSPPQQQQQRRSPQQPNIADKQQKSDDPPKKDLAKGDLRNKLNTIRSGRKSTEAEEVSDTAKTSKTSTNTVKTPPKPSPGSEANPKPQRVRGQPPADKEQPKQKPATRQPVPSPSASARPSTTKTPPKPSRPAAAAKPVDSGKEADQSKTDTTKTVVVDEPSNEAEEGDWESCSGEEDESGKNSQASRHSPSKDGSQSVAAQSQPVTESNDESSVEVKESSIPVSTGAEDGTSAEPSNATTEESAKEESDAGKDNAVNDDDEQPAVREGGLRTESLDRIQREMIDKLNENIEAIEAQLTDDDDDEDILANRVDAGKLVSQ